MNKRIKMTAIYLITMGLYSGLIYLAIFKDLVWAERLTVATTIFILITTIGIVKSDPRASTKTEFSYIPQFLDRLWDGIIFCVFIGAGWWFTGIIFGLHIWLLWGLRDKVRELQAKEANNVDETKS